MGTDMQNDKTWTYGPTGLPVESSSVHNQPTLVMRAVPAAPIVPPTAPPTVAPAPPPVIRVRRWRRLLARVLIVCALLLVTVAAACAFFWYNPMTLGLVSEPFLAPQAGAVPWNGTDPINILAMGVDQRVRGEQTQSDTMIVIQLDPGSGKVRMLSIPRDLAVDVPGYGQLSKINEGYYIGGASYAAFVVEHSLGIPINYYAVLRFSGFQKLIDAVGGVDVTIDTNINDPAYPALVGNGFDPFVISKGPHHLDGATALKYVRERHQYSTSGGDEMRNKHQQQLLDALKKQVMSVYTLFHLPAILSALRDTIDTNLPNNQLLSVGMLMLKDRSIEHLYINEAAGLVYQCTGYDKGADLCPTNALQPKLGSLFQNNRLANEHATVWVQDGMGSLTISKIVKDALTASHFNVAGLGFADTSNHAHTAVIVNSAEPAAPYTTRLLQQMFGARLLTRSMPEIHAQLVLLLGNDVARCQVGSDCAY